MGTIGVYLVLWTDDYDTSDYDGLRRYIRTWYSLGYQVLFSYTGECYSDLDRIPELKYFLEL